MLSDAWNSVSAAIKNQFSICRMNLSATSVLSCTLEQIIFAVVTLTPSKDRKPLKLTNFYMIYCQWINLCQARGKKTILIIQDSVSSMIAKSMFIRIPKMFKSKQSLENRWVLKMISEKDICSKYCTMDLSPSHLCQMICLSNNKPAVWEVASIGTSFPKNSTCLWYQPSALQEKHGF